MMKFIVEVNVNELPGDKSKAHLTADILEAVVRRLRQPGAQLFSMAIGSDGNCLAIAGMREVEST